MSRSTVYRMLAALETGGYVAKRAGGGRGNATEWELLKQCHLGDTVSATETVSTSGTILGVNSVSLGVNSVTQGETPTSNQPVINQEEQVINQEEEKTRTQRGPSPNAKKTEARITPSTGDELFNDFWRQYPRRQAKVHAKRAFMRLTRPNQNAAIDGIALWLASGQWDDPRYIPLPASYINGQRWADEIPERAKNEKGKGGVGWRETPGEILERLRRNADAGLAAAGEGEGDGTIVVANVGGVWR